jgi:hypothetical protein
MRSAWGPLLAAALIVASALTGCAPQPAPAPAASAAATDPPVFASDAEALAAATKAYASYLAAIDAMLAQGGGDVSTLADVASGDALEAETKTAEMYAGRGYRSLGITAFDSLRMQTIDDREGKATLSAYLCSDVSAVDVVNDAGVSVVPADRVDRFPLQVTFESTLSNSERLLISSSESWAGTNFC